MTTETHSEHPPILLEVAGSEGRIYVITARRRGGEMTISCTCNAGENRMACKHRLALLAGDGGGLVKGSADDVAAIVAWLPGSALARQLQAVDEAEQAVAAARKRLSAAKKALGRIMDVGG